MSPADEPGPLVFVVDLDRPELDDPQHHHLSRVLRLRPGAPLTVGDGRGGWRTARFGARLEPTGPTVHDPPPRPALTVAVARLKGDRPELVVQKLTELGIDRIAFFAAERSVVRWEPDRQAQHLQRLRSVARAAAMQCHRAYLPSVDHVELGDLAAIDGVRRADRGGAALTGLPPAVVVGPEGGWSPVERATIPGSIGLGPHVLRAETAAVAVATLLGALRHGLVAPFAGECPDGAPATT